MVFPCRCPARASKLAKPARVERVRAVLVLGRKPDRRLIADAIGLCRGTEQLVGLVVHAIGLGDIAADLLPGVRVPRGHRRPSLRSPLRTAPTGNDARQPDPAAALRSVLRKPRQRRVRVREGPCALRSEAARSEIRSPSAERRRDHVRLTRRCGGALLPCQTAVHAADCYIRSTLAGRSVKEPAPAANNVSRSMS